MTHRSTFAFALLAAASFGMAQSVTLRLNPPLNKTLRYSVTNKMTMTGPMSMTISQQLDLAATPKQKTAKGNLVSSKLSNIRVTAEPKGAMGDQLSQGAKKMEGATFEAVYDARANVVPGSEKSSAGARALGQMGAMGFGFMGIMFPATPVSAGSTWTTTVDIGKMLGGAMGGQIQAKNTKIPAKFKLTKIVRGGGQSLAHIDYTMKGTLNLAMNSGGQSAPMTVAIDMGGKIVVNTATGVPTSGTSKGTSSMSVQGMSFQQQVNSSFTLK